MKARIEKGRLSVDLSELVDGLGPEDRKTLARMLGAKEHLFASVLECVSDESRFGYYANDDEDGAWWFDPRMVLQLRERLIPFMSAIAREAVRQALVERNAAKEDARRMNEWAWKLYHAWPDRAFDSRPSTIGYTEPPPVREDELPPKDGA